MTQVPPKPKRLFLALWPNAAEQSQLHAIAQHHCLSNKARPVAANKLHLTLSFLGVVESEKELCVRRVAAEVDWEPIELEFDRLGWFAHPKVLWAGCSTVPVELKSLAGRLQAELSGCGIKSERRQFQPHITLARKQDRPPTHEQIEPLVCRFDRLSLVESRLDSEGASYITLANW